jgi:ribonuclease HI
MSATTFFINTDGGARGNPGPSAIGVVVQDQSGKIIHEISRYTGHGTNNEAEYQAFIDSIEWLASAQIDTRPEKVIWRLDSQLVVSQLNKTWKIKEARLLALAQQIWQKLDALPYSFEIIYVPRAQNSAADALVNQALDAATA